MIANEDDRMYWMVYEREHVFPYTTANLLKLINALKSKSGTKLLFGKGGGSKQNDTTRVSYWTKAFAAGEEEVFSIRT